MTLDYTVRGQVRIAILSYIEEIITASDKEDPKGKTTKSSASPNNIPVVNKDCKKLYQEKHCGVSHYIGKDFLCYYKDNT